MSNMAPRVLALLVISASALSAQETPRHDSTAVDTTRVARLAPLEVTVTRSLESRVRVPAAVGVISQTDLRRAQLTSGLDEALGRIPGVLVANRYNFSLDQRLSLRGAGS